MTHSVHIELRPFQCDHCIVIITGDGLRPSNGCKTGEEQPQRRSNHHMPKQLFYLAETQTQHAHLPTSPARFW
jgi:hypothetical protein